MNKYKVIIFCFLFIIPSIIFAQTENTKKVIIHIQHGIKINDDIPGYRIIVANWGCREIFELNLVDTDGNIIKLINSNQNVKSDEDGMISIDIPYTYGEIKPGICMLIVSGKLGVHWIKIEYPRLEPPTEEKPYWDLWFSNTNNPSNN